MTPSSGFAKKMPRRKRLRVTRTRAVPRAKWPRAMRFWIGWGLFVVSIPFAWLALRSVPTGTIGYSYLVPGIVFFVTAIVVHVRYRQG
jgi:hypothetical protein